MTRQFCSRCGERYDGVSRHGPGTCGEPKPRTQVETLREILSDGNWHSTSEILRFHPMIVHSRVADLRKKGYAVEHRAVGPGAPGSHYRIALGEPSSAANGGSPSATHDGARPGYEGGSRSPLLPAEPQANMKRLGMVSSAPEEVRVQDYPSAASNPSDAMTSDRQGQPADERGDEPHQVGEASVPLRLPGQLAIDDLAEDRCAAYCAQFCRRCGERYDGQTPHGPGWCPKEDSAA